MFLSEPVFRNCGHDLQIENKIRPLSSISQLFATDSLEIIVALSVVARIVYVLPMDIVLSMRMLSPAFALEEALRFFNSL